MHRLKLPTFLRTEPAFKSPSPPLFHHKSATKKPAGKRGRPRKPIISNSKFQPAPLSGVDWERIAAHLAANWKAHFTAKNVKFQAQNQGNPRKSLLIDLGNLASSLSD
ncbi:hypothetical protein PtB15_14B80 [Puccinia triticina]|nr:hypothetical protein PtB15_14B80 [Puccinia triticina]